MVLMNTVRIYKISDFADDVKKNLKDMEAFEKYLIKLSAAENSLENSSQLSAVNITKESTDLKDPSRILKEVAAKYSSFLKNLVIGNNSVTRRRLNHPYKCYDCTGCDVIKKGTPKCVTTLGCFTVAFADGPKSLHQTDMKTRRSCLETKNVEFEIASCYFRTVVDGVHRCRKCFRNRCNKFNTKYLNWIIDPNNNKISKRLDPSPDINASCGVIAFCNNFLFTLLYTLNMYF